MTDAKTGLEASINQWQLYDSSVEDLTNWLAKTEAVLNAEDDQESTLSEKRAQLDRMKVGSSSSSVFYYIFHCHNRSAFAQ